MTTIYIDPAAAPTTDIAATEDFSVPEAVSTVCILHSDTLGLLETDITSEKADKFVSKAHIQTTTEVLLLLARFHADNDDSEGAALLAKFAVEFADHERGTV